MESVTVEAARTEVRCFGMGRRQPRSNSNPGSFAASSVPKLYEQVGEINDQRFDWDNEKHFLPQKLPLNAMDHERSAVFGRVQIGAGRSVNIRFSMLVSASDSRGEEGS